jgi:tetratricopeptide (TPR) repeat protein
MGRHLLALVVALAVAHQATAQNTHAGHGTPAVPLELLARQVGIRGGIGSMHHPATTSSAPAQQLYDQGLAYLHHYSWIEAARSFNAALRLDSELVLALVGLSVAYVELSQPGAAQQALARATRLAADASLHDRTHAEVRARQFAAEIAPTDVAKAAAYRRALDDALRRFPADVELLLSRGMAEASHPGDRGQSSTMTAIPFYEKALAAGPELFAPRHYLAHAFENAGRTSEALAHGAAYAKLAPEVPHSRHMYGHSLRRTGRVREAIAQFETADRLHVAYFTAERVPAELDWHYAHNLDLLGTSFMFIGQMRRAEQALKKSFVLPTSTLLQTFNKRQWPLFLRSRGRHDDARAAAAALVAHPDAVIQAIGRIESGHSHLAAGNFAQAASEANAAIAALRSARIGAGVATLALENLQGEFYLRAGPREKGRRLLAEVVDKAGVKQGPDEWAEALLTFELIAAAARDVGDWELADRIARKMLEHHPQYAGAHYALGLVAMHDGAANAARVAFTQAERYWSQADPDLQERLQVRTWLKANGTVP